MRLIADDLVALLETQAPRLSAKDRERAELYGRTAVGLLRYHDGMAEASPDRIGRLSALRDGMMAATCGPAPSTARPWSSPPTCTSSGT
ncbi:hypothetical protein [Nonomuraea fuscirosea]|uniref:hypothetical protein n=1 Tax=Nonomuraea fuscirosea TaxID=1291556 RepID=UPI00341B9243